MPFRFASRDPAMACRLSGRMGNAAAPCRHAPVSKLLAFKSARLSRGGNRSGCLERGGNGSTANAKALDQSLVTAFVPRLHIVEERTAR
jgi:hypothetical protein